MSILSNAKRVNSNIRAYMARRNMTVELLSQRSGLSKSTLYNRQNDPQNYKLEELIIISKVLNVKLEELIKEG